MSFQNWHEEFDEFWPEHLKVSKIFILMGSFWAKHILFELIKYSGVIFLETEKGYKIWRGIYLSFQDWHKEFEIFLTWARKSLKTFHFDRLFLSKVYIIWAKKSTDELSFTKLKRDTKFREESTCHFKTDMRNLTNFDSSTLKSKKIAL